MTDQVPLNTIPLGRGPGASGFSNVANGTAGQVLTAQGGASPPIFSDAGSGDMVKSVYDPDLNEVDIFGGGIFVETVAQADALSLPNATVAPRTINATYYDTNYEDGSDVSFKYSGTVTPAAPGQIDISVAGVTTFYVRSNRVIRPEQWGMRSGGSATANTAALAAMLNYQNYCGYEIDMGESFRQYDIDDTVTHFPTRKSIIRGTGAVIRLVSASPKFFALRFSTNNQEIDHEGFAVDANLLTPNALWYENTALSFSADNKKITLIGVAGYNGKRILITDYFGSGIAIRGAWTTSLMRDCSCSLMVTASGANDASVGICGFYIGRDGNGLYPITKDIINPTIGPIYSEDSTMVFNMDGMNIQDHLPSSNDDRTAASTYVNGGSYTDSWGRAIKVQGQNIDIYAPMIIQNNGPDVGGGVKRSTTFVSLQYGEGTVRGLRAFCGGASTISAVDGTARSFGAGKMLITGLQISGESTTPNIDKLGFRYSDSGAPRGSLEVSSCSVQNMGVNYGAEFYSRLNGLENVVFTNNQFTSVATGGVKLQNDSGGNVIFVNAENNFQKSSSVPMIPTPVTATATLYPATGAPIAAANPGFT